MTDKPLRYNIGIVGTGAFPLFSASAFLKVQGIHIHGVFDLDKDRADSFAEQFHCRVYAALNDLLEDEAIDIVYIATPPFLHFEQSKVALQRGKHVICEKPAALKAAEVAELITIADEHELLYVVNLMQRYNPLFLKMKKLVDAGIMGSFLHGYFENYASDESLSPGHWMWDEKLSGGIFLEHAVHFFDLFEGWLGEGKVITSQKIKRPDMDTLCYPEVLATVKYDPGIVNFYHGFTQASRMDRQEMKFLFDNGEVVLYEWVPTQMIVRGLFTLEELEEFKEIFPDGEYAIIEEYKGDERSYKSQFKERTADVLMEGVIGKDSEKLNIYQNLLTDMLSDQLAWIRDRNHKRQVTSENAYRSVLIAEMAEQKAQLL